MLKDVERHAPCNTYIQHADSTHLKGEILDMTAAFLMNGAQYICLIGVLAIAWGWLQRVDPE